MHRSWNSQALFQMCLQFLTSFRGLSALYSLNVLAISNQLQRSECALLLLEKVGPHRYYPTTLTGQPAAHASTARMRATRHCTGVNALRALGGTSRWLSGLQVDSQTGQALLADVYSSMFGRGTSMDLCHARGCARAEW